MEDECREVVRIPQLLPHPVECPICLADVQSNSCITTECGHTTCLACLLQFFFVKLQSEGVSAPFPCPTCRQNLRLAVRVRCPEQNIDGLPNVDGARTILCVPDRYGNWHTVCVLVGDCVAYGVAYGLETIVGRTRPLPNYQKQQTHWYNAGEGYYVKPRPRDNPNFEILSRWKLDESTSRWHRYDPLMNP